MPILAILTVKIEKFEFSNKVIASTLEPFLVLNTCFWGIYTHKSNLGMKNKFFKKFYFFVWVALRVPILTSLTVKIEKFEFSDKVVLSTLESFLE